MTKNFKRYEFECKCGCGLDCIDPKLVYMLQQMRQIIQEPIIITSGCRCDQHNYNVGGKSNSSHLPRPLCKAADVKALTNQDIYKLIKAAIKVGFKRIGINFNKRFIHLDIDLQKINPIIFNY